MRLLRQLRAPTRPAELTSHWEHWVPLSLLLLAEAGVGGACCGGGAKWEARWSGSDIKHRHTCGVEIRVFPVRLPCENTDTQQSILIGHDPEATTNQIRSPTLVSHLSWTLPSALGSSPVQPAAAEEAGSDPKETFCKNPTKIIV